MHPPLSFPSPFPFFSSSPHLHYTPSYPFPSSFSHHTLPSTPSFHCYIGTGHNLTFLSHIISSSPIGLLDPENIGIAVRIVLLSCLQVEIGLYVFPNWRSPSWISDFRLFRTVFSIVPLDSFRKHGGGRWNFVPILSTCWDLRGEGGNHPARHFTFLYKFTSEQNVLKFVHQKMWKWITQRRTEAFLKNSRGIIYGVWKTQGYPLPSVVRGLTRNKTFCTWWRVCTLI